MCRKFMIFDLFTTLLNFIKLHLYVQAQSDFDAFPTDQNLFFFFIRSFILDTPWMNVCYVLYSKKISR